jgi:proline dehydrogenase
MLPQIVRSFGNFFFLHIMSRWVAGASPREAAVYCSKIGIAGSGCMINLLGEHYRSSELAERAVGEYKILVDEISSRGITASLTLKPSQFGFNAEDASDPEKFCAERMLEVVRYASEKGILVWLDMEDSRFTDFTLDFYAHNYDKYALGICLQANLRRTKGDIDRLIRLSENAPVRLRLVKGIYAERAGIAITDAKALHKKFLELIGYSFEKSPANFGMAVGSHHEEAIELALRLQEKHKKEFFEIQVLKGVMPGYYEKLRRRGVKVTEYVPYGPDAFAYSVRRARKNPRFAASILFAPFFDAYKKLYG